MTRIPVALLLVLDAVLACRGRSTARLSPEDETAVRNVDVVFAAAMNTSDVPKMVSVYATDAVLLPPEMPPQAGTDAIQGFFTAMQAQATPQIALKATRIEGQGDVAYIVGEYRITMTPKTAGAASEAKEEGKYLEVLRRQPDGTWKLVADMFSANAPPPARTAAAPRKQ